MLTPQGPRQTQIPIHSSRTAGEAWEGESEEVSTLTDGWAAWVMRCSSRAAVQELIVCTVERCIVLGFTVQKLSVSPEEA